MAAACTAALSVAPDFQRALDEVCDAGGVVGADLACLFVAGAHAGAAERGAAEVRRRLGPRALVGCTAAGTLGGEREVEQGPSLALWTASLPEAAVETFHARAASDEQGVRFEGLPAMRPGDTLLLFPDPFSLPFAELLGRLPAGVATVGGIASAATAPGGNRLLVDGRAVQDGMVGALLRGAGVTALVSQGCRPIGRPFVVTQAKENVVLGLAGRPAVERLHQVLAELDDGDRALVRRGLLVGRALDEYKEHHGSGDFLIRNVLGVDAASGSLAVSERLRVGQTVQFHVRDGSSAADDLARGLREARTRMTPAGALLFTCNGRGRRMYGRPDVDAQTVQEAFGGVPLAGFFAGGEIGPVGGANFLHGFSASLALFAA